jgi:hypothetical protein
MGRRSDAGLARRKHRAGPERALAMSCHDKAPAATPSALCPGYGTLPLGVVYRHDGVDSDALAQLSSVALSSTRLHGLRVLKGSLW